jgi:hypothetical protein
MSKHEYTYTVYFMIQAPRIYIHYIPRYYLYSYKYIYTYIYCAYTYTHLADIYIPILVLGIPY